MRLVALSIAAVMSTLIVSASSPAAHAAPAQNVNKSESKTVKIEPGDSLSAIAKEHGSTVQRLFNANLKIENPDLIYPGEQVRVPSPDEKLATRPMPVAAPVAPVAPAAPAPAATSTYRPAAQAASTASAAANGSVWDRLAQCESGGNWSINTGNGYYGGLQFSLSSWRAVGGSGLPSDASRDEQIMRGQMLQARQGWGAWPACTAKLGIR